MTKISRVLALAAAFAGLAEIAIATPLLLENRVGPAPPPPPSPPSPPPKKCKKPVKRRAWHTLSNKDKKAYLDAQVCVMSRPGNPALPGVRTLHDEMVSIHQLHTLTIHSTGIFLPWHRWYLDLHERNLRSCGYTGALPYWDEHHDALTLPVVSASSVFDPVTGFGSEGAVAPDYCLTDGPFVGYLNSIGPNWDLTDGCIGRHHTPATNPLRDVAILNTPLLLPGGANVTAQTAHCLSLTTYVEAATCLYLTPHVAGHIGMGSTRGDPFASPSDPLFYLHHAYIDKLWFQWQEQDPTTRTHAIGGNNKQDPDTGFLELPGGMAFEKENFLSGSEPNAAQLALAPSGDEGDGGGDVVTLNHTLTSYGRIPDVKAGDVMDVRGGYLCYEYV